jgi:hypothetical protein
VPDASKLLKVGLLARLAGVWGERTEVRTEVDVDALGLGSLLHVAVMVMAWAVLTMVMVWSGFLLTLWLLLAVLLVVLSKMLLLFLQSLSVSGLVLRSKLLVRVVLMRLVVRPQYHRVPYQVEGHMRESATHGRAQSRACKRVSATRMHAPCKHNTNARAHGCMVTGQGVRLPRPSPGSS